MSCTTANPAAQIFPQDTEPRRVWFVLEEAGQHALANLSLWAQSALLIHLKGLALRRHPQTLKQSNTKQQPSLCPQWHLMGSWDKDACCVGEMNSVLC